MANITSSKQYINDVEVNADAALSENLFDRIGGAINYLNDQDTAYGDRLDDLETEVGSASTFTSSSTAATGTIKSVSITPTGTNVMYFPAGIFQMQSAGQTATIQVQRNGSALYSVGITATTPASLYPFLDTGATSGGSNTYRIQVTAISGTMTYTNAAISAADLK